MMLINRLKIILLIVLNLNTVRHHRFTGLLIFKQFLGVSQLTTAHIHLI